jgi:hypothetical protein
LIHSIYTLKYLRDPQLHRKVHRSQNRIFTDMSTGMGCDYWGSKPKPPLSSIQLPGQFLSEHSFHHRSSFSFSPEILNQFLWHIQDNFLIPLAAHLRFFPRTSSFIPFFADTESGPWFEMGWWFHEIHIMGVPAYTP